MIALKKFIIGSKAFFDNFPDYDSHDVDELWIVDKLPSENLTSLNLRKDKNDVFFFKNMDKSQFIEITLKKHSYVRW